ncbi:orotidine-5'-phosphate decarboxylase [Paenibacillus sp. J2TS4]|uniref:orotidine-5'-phosphate decarboxylase n=1 Tax=Paenibacillus sp. J2TS4 TaxID=2807194 RepID=UPI001BCB7617|nr:orotidine-5'-phosphate decarboxylase [Paenibacillus sp. J2TS4]
MVALDYPDEREAAQLLQSLQGIPCYMKVGMQLFYSAGPQFVAGLKEQGYKVFLDLKLHDIPNTVKGAAASIARLGVDMFNVHAAGGVRMMEAALEGVDRASGASPVVIGVTQLTSTDERMLQEEIGIHGTIEETVVRYARLAGQAGLHGVVASPREVGRIKEALGSSFITVTPGIRPQGSEIGDQARVMTPAEAFREGTDYVVIGRPITAQADPRQALETIMEELI